MACMLAVDNNDRRGNERVWVSVMDSVGGTASNKWGAHNGWHQGGASTGINDVTGFVSNNQQPGTTWDLYGVKASESLTTQAHAFGSRYSNRASMGLLTGKTIQTGPTKKCCASSTRVVALMTGDLNSGVLGPFANRSRDDIDLLNDTLTNSGGHRAAAWSPSCPVTASASRSADRRCGLPRTPRSLTRSSAGASAMPRIQSVSGNTNGCADLRPRTSSRRTVTCTASATPASGRTTFPAQPGHHRSHRGLAVRARGRQPPVHRFRVQAVDRCPSVDRAV